VQSRPIPTNTDVILLTHPVYAPLNNTNRKLFLKIHPASIFEKADAEFLSSELVMRWSDGKRVKQGIDAGLPNKRSVYLKLCLLRMERYDAPVWIDSDFMVLHSLGGAFRSPFSPAMGAAGPEARLRHFTLSHKLGARADPEAQHIHAPVREGGFPAAGEKPNQHQGSIASAAFLERLEQILPSACP
jgi:hypothetical protein